MTKAKTCFGLSGSHVLLVLAVFVSLTSLRLFGSAYSGFWYDEIFSIKISHYPMAEVHHYAALDVHPSTYYKMLHFFLKPALEFGDGRAAVALLRLSSILPNLLLIICLFWWVLSRWGRAVGLTALVAAGFSPGMVYYSIELRNYGWTMLFVCLSSLSLIEVIARPARKWKIFYVICTLAYLNLHYVAMAVYACQAVFHFAILQEAKRRGEAPRWMRELLPHFIILALLVPQLGFIWVKYRDFYAPANMFVYNAKFIDIFRTFSLDFPAGPFHELTSRDHIYGWVAQGASLLFYAFLGYFWFQDRKRFPLTEPYLTTIRLCTWMLFSFLGGTWFISVMKWAEVYSGFRTAMLVIPLWILLILALIETGIRPRLRPVLRWTFALWMVPCAILVTVQRIHYADGLREVREYARLRLAHSPGSAKPVFYHDDPFLTPWLQRVEGSVRIDSLASLLTINPTPAYPVRVIVHTAPDIRVRRPMEVKVVNLIRSWNSRKASHCSVEALGGFELFTIPANERAEFIGELKKIAAGTSTGSAG